MAYRLIGDIIEVIEETVDVIEVLKPICNFKSGCGYREVCVVG